MRRRRANLFIPLACLAVAIFALPGRAKEHGAAAPALAAFNGTRAFSDLKLLVGFGARPSGSNNLASARQWMLAGLRQTGAEVEEDKFAATTPIGQLTMSNLIAKYPGTSANIVIVAGHYDTARVQDVNFLGANDGGSSAALLLELARSVAGRKYPFTLWLVFFDGEEAAQQWSATDSLYGSRHLVDKLSSTGQLSRVKAMILVDMIGDPKLEIYRDSNSTGWLNDLVFSTAHRLGYGRVFRDQAQEYGDDHVPFVDAGVAAVDLLGNVGPATPTNSFGAYWHSAEDTLNHCSQQSLAIVGRVVLASLDELGRSPHVQ